MAIGDSINSLLGNPAFQFGTALLGQSGWHDRPVSLGQQLGGALQQFQQMQAGEFERQMKQKEAERKQKEFDAALKAAEGRQKAVDRIANLAEKDPRSAALIAMQSGDPELEEWGMKRLFPDPTQAGSPLGKLQADLAAGLITPEQMDRELSYRYRPPVSPVSVNLGQMIGPGLGGEVLGLGATPQGAALIRKPGGEVTYAVIPNAPKPFEQAAKISASREGIRNVDEARNLLFDEEGNYNRGVAAGAWAGLPQEDMRMTRLHILNAVEAQLRAESGAAVPQSEVERAAQRFMPNPLDSAEVVRMKLNELQERLRGSMELSGKESTVPGLGQPGPPAPTQQPMTGAPMDQPIINDRYPSGTPNNPVPVMSEDEADMLPVGTYVIIDGRLGIVED